MNDVRVPVWIKKATISFPKQEDTPIVMIGPGNAYVAEGLRETL